MLATNTPTSHGWSLWDVCNGMRTKDDIILKAKLEDLKQLMRSKNIRDKHAGFAACPQLGLGLKHKLQPIEANLQVCVAVTMEDMRKLRPSCSN
jgi:hypothetical protein